MQIHILSTCDNIGGATFVIFLFSFLHNTYTNGMILYIENI